MVFSIIKRKNIKSIVSLVLILLNISCSNQNSASYSFGSYLKESYEARSFLNRSFFLTPAGAYLVVPSEKIEAVEANWPGDSLINDVTEQQSWRTNSHYHFMLQLDDDLLSSYTQNNSDTMTAVILLDHYFGGLCELGFQDMGAPKVFSSYSTQFAGNTWSKENSNISIIGHVYIDVQNKTSLITVDISEIY